MATKMFLNLSVRDLDKSISFFTRLGFSFNPQFTDERAACMIVSDDIFVMLLTEPFFKTFIKKEIVDARTGTEAIIGLSANSREDVDIMIGRAIEAGATTPINKQDHGFMYSHGFEDLDGHLWEIIWMDMSAVPG